MQLKSVAFLTFLIFSLVTASATQAKPNKPVPSAKTPVIEEVQVTFADESNCQGGTESVPVDTLTIMGTGFVASDGVEPVVTLGLLPPLTVCDFAEAYVVAMLPLTATDGDYLLSVIMAVGVGTFDLTIGAVGPQGPDGDQGPRGEKGPPGEPGLAGEGCTITQCGVGDTSATMSCPGSTDVEIPCLAEDLATQLQRTCYDAGGTWDAGTRTCTAASNYNCFLGGYCTAVETYFTVNGWTSQWTSIYTGHTEWTEPKCALEAEEKAQWRQGQRYAEYSINNVEAIRQEWLNDGQVCGNRCRLPALVESIACGGL